MRSQQESILHKRMLDLQQASFRTTREETVKQDSFEDLCRFVFSQTPNSIPVHKRHPGVAYSDIVLHLPVLEYYASLCSHVTEFGVRDGHSTVAFASGLAKPYHHTSLRSYDIERSAFVSRFATLEKPYLLDWKFTQGDTSDPNLAVEETDLLFFDTLHTATHLSKELALWAKKARLFLIFHDTFTCGERDLSGPDPMALGIWPAIKEFLENNPGEYFNFYQTNHNNGLLVLGTKRAVELLTGLG